MILKEGGKLGVSVLQKKAGNEGMREKRRMRWKIAFFCCLKNVLCSVNAKSV